MEKLYFYVRDLDWILLAAVLLVAGLGIATMHSFVGENYFFERQLVWIAVSFGALVLLSGVDFRFLRRTGVVVSLFILSCFFLLLLLVVGATIQGAQRWLDLGLFSFQVSEFVKIALIILLAKYFTKRHIEIQHFRHIFISGIYASILFVLVFFQPDFGSAIIVGLIWLGMVAVSGISKKHLAFVFVVGALLFVGVWSFALEDYQKGRIMSFLQPYADVEGSGYHTRQSTIAIGSGELWGKGVGYGTQSQLRFLPEHETDFIFAAYAEEWGFAGVILLFLLFGVIILRILETSSKGETNFEILFGVGVAVLLISHMTIHIGANVGLLPVTGTTLPFMSFGGSHILASFVALGILMGMRRYRRIVHRERVDRELTAV